MGDHVAAKPWWRDALERVGWTAAEAGVATAIVVVAELPYEWVPILSAALAVLKAWIAKKKNGTAAIG